MQKCSKCQYWTRCSNFNDTPEKDKKYYFKEYYFDDNENQCESIDECINQMFFKEKEGDGIIGRYKFTIITSNVEDWN